MKRRNMAFITARLDWKITLIIGLFFIGLLLYKIQEPESTYTWELASEDKMPTGGDLLLRHNQRRLGNYSQSQAVDVFQRMKKDFRAKSREFRQKDGGINEWEWKGPGNIGGRVRSIVVVPNKANPTKEDIIIGSTGGGIWKSYDEGSTWTAIDDFMPNLIVSSLAVHPSRPDTIYAGTGELFSGGAGVFISTDRGDTWRRLSATDTSSFRVVNRLLVDPNKSSTIYAAGFNLAGFPNRGILQKSTDAGESWQTIANFPSPAMDIDMDPSDPSIILVGCANDVIRILDQGNGNYLQSSIVGGVNQIPASPGRVEVAYAPSANGLVYASIQRNFGEIWVSPDSGLNWQQVGGNKSHGRGGTGNLLWWANTMWVDPLDSTNIVFASLDIHKSLDGGLTHDTISDWTVYHNGVGTHFSAHADNHIIIPSLFYSAVNPKVYVGNDGGIQTTDNIWTVNRYSGWVNLCNSSLGITQFYGASASMDGQVFAGGTQDNGFMFGQNSSNWFQPVTGDGSKVAISQTNPNIIYYNINYNSLHLSIDGGQTSRLKADFGFDESRHCTNFPGHSCCLDTLDYCQIGDQFYVQDSAELIAEFIKDPDDDLTIYAGGMRLWRSTDSMSTWTMLRNYSTPTSQITAIDSRDSGAVIAAGYNTGQVYMSYDQGVTWRPDSLRSNLTSGVINDISIHPRHTNQIAAATSSWSSVPIALSLDSGTTWNAIKLPYDIPVLSILWHPTNADWLYAGTYLGIFASEDKGRTWNVSPIIGSTDGSVKGDGPLFVQVEELFWQGNGTTLYPYHLCAATHGRGIWRSKYAILDKIYVDKNCNLLCGNGTMQAPFTTLREAVNKAGNGSTIVFLSEFTHDEIPQHILISKRLMIETMNDRVIIE